ncbi:uncharacterized protein JCM6883_005604 [Sporobolomyces salmoneus]|uniref:uncharacterized protein n=1 Tax=Sporobolomyces salmoneus TaxID=183962 RepID=UPI003179A1BC
MYTTSHHSGSSSRGVSLDYDSRNPSLDAPSSVVSDPFVDRSLYDPSSASSGSRTSSRSSSRVRTGAQQPQRNPWSPLSSENGDDSPSPSSSSPPAANGSNRPGLPHSTSTELSRQISAALSEDLPSPSEETNYSNGNGNGMTSEAMAGRKRSESAATLKAARNNLSSSGKSSGSSSGGFLSQFRTGSGWFAPMVEPEKPLSREEFAAKEKQRIEKLKAGKPATRRPGLMKRLSSGLELSSVLAGSGGGGGGSPSKR